MKILACKVGKSRLNYDICKYFFYWVASFD